MDHVCIIYKKNHLHVVNIEIIDYILLLSKMKRCQNNHRSYNSKKSKNREVINSKEYSENIHWEILTQALVWV